MELKLELTLEAADALERAGLFAGKRKIVRQHAIYFDAPGHALSAAGFSLRIRRNGKKRFQTIKAGDGSAAGLFARPEWERDVEDDRPALDETTPILALLGDKIADIRPLFTVENERRVWTFDGIEVSLDRGRIVSGDRETRAALPTRDGQWTHGTAVRGSEELGERGTYWRSRIATYRSHRQTP